MALHLLIVLSCICNCLTLTTEPGHVRQLTDKDFKTFTESQHVRVVYFQESTVPKNEELSVKHFLSVFDKSCRLLEPYNVECAQVDCATYQVEDYCARPTSPNVVYTFRRGAEFMELSLDSMFDVDSVISNILQIVLLQQVPILQTARSRKEYEQKFIGKRDVIFSYHSVIGTYEHRIMMELAYAYRDKYQFAMTTERDGANDLRGYVPDTPEAVAFWVLHCKDVSDKKKRCPVTRYRDSVNLISLARFLRVLDLKPIVTLPGGDHTVYEKSDMHVAAVLATKKTIKALTIEMEALAQIYRGFVGFVVVDKSKFDVTKLGFEEVAADSTFALKLRGETEWLVMPEADHPESFLEYKLAATVLPPRKPRRDQTTESKDVPEGEDVSPIETEDDVVAKAARVARYRKLDHKHVLHLTQESFTAETKKRDFLMVMFYLIFDARSVTSLFSYFEASRLLAAESLYPLATVECHDDLDACTSQNITTYPTIRMYQKGRRPVEYTGMRGPQEIVSYVKLFMADAPIKLNSFEEATQFMNGNIPKGISSATDISVLGLFTDNSDAVKKAFRIAARKLRGQMVFGETTGDVAVDIAKSIPNTDVLPKVAVHKRHDDFRPVQVCPSFTSSKKVVQCAKDGAMLMFPELTATTFPMLFGENLPFLILFTHGRDNAVYQTLGTLSADVNVPNVNYCWMNLDAADGLALKILKGYHDNNPPTTPSLSIVDYQKGAIYHYDQTIYNKDTIVPWIEAILEGKTKPTKDLPVGKWKPMMEGYDFLKLMAKEVGKMSQSEMDEDAVANEHGLGFDSDGNYITEETDDGSKVSPELEAAENEIREELLRLSRFYPRRGHADKTKKAHHGHTEL